jgi:predicted metalloprotease with PDZ domain
MLLALLAAPSLLGAAKSDGIVAYALTPEIRNGELAALDVTVRLRADPSGVTKLALPDKDSGVSSLWRHLSDLTIDGAKAVQADDPAHRAVISAPGAPLTIRYRVVSAFDHDPGVDDLDTYKPTIRPRWFWAYGEALFIHPEDGRRRATFTWTGAPKAFPFTSNLEHARGAPMPIDDLLQSVSVGGPDVQIFHREAGGAPVRVAEIGRYGFDGAAFADMAARVIDGERRFWGGREGPFLVALGPLVPSPGVRSVRGEGRGDAFALMTTTDAPLEFLKATLAHEYFHTWNPLRLGGLAAGDAQRADYWFSEGFTDFYARRLLLRMGAFTPDAFATAWNEKLRAYAVSPVRSEPNARIVQDFWRNHDVEALPYQRGAILAATFDQRLRALSGGKIGLDAVMLTMRDRAAADGPKSPKAPNLFVETARRFGLDPAPDIAAVIDRGEPAVLPEDAFGPCFKVRTLTTPTFDRGFDIEATIRTHTLAGVKPSSPAYAAGLRDGMPLLKLIGGVYGDSRAPYTVVVRDGGAELTIVYKPEGEGRMTFQEVQTTTAAAGPEASRCAGGV